MNTRLLGATAWSAPAAHRRHGDRAGRQLGGTAIITVTDRGCGIAEDIREHLKGKTNVMMVRELKGIPEPQQPKEESASPLRLRLVWSGAVSGSWSSKGAMSNDPNASRSKAISVALSSTSASRIRPLEREVSPFEVVGPAVVEREVLIDPEDEVLGALVEVADALAGPFPLPGAENLLERDVHRGFAVPRPD